ncbi:MAG TPA: hypothetical protein VFO10_17635 [Oligoflexus sp.]|uniref:hypothetical protein n=1 Tax=Oligoflexus sp. TaxID=1971216 RepID=UPI002D7E92F2|nr:hypothetical protein [Oligoflexus sp.]HET9239085.1 hypothetical protein [Oligoflexus sp.]
MKSVWHFMVMLFFSSPLMASMIPPRAVPYTLNERLSNGMNRSDFDAVLDQIEVVYRPIFESLGGDLSLERFWDSSRVDAHSSQVRNNWIIRVYGGVARHPAITRDGLALVVCHEIGHHLAGFPQVSSWAATEGNADYYATQTCLKTIWGNAAPVDLEISDKAEARCQAASPSGQAFCVRALQASYSVASFLADLEAVSISWDQPDLTEVTSTNLSYPPVQCRFDTLIAGTFCDRPSSHLVIPWNEKEMAAASCHALQKDERGLRPRCWFRSRLPQDQK